MKKWWQGRTLRFRLALWYAAGGALLLAAFSTALYIFVAERMAKPLDLELRQDLAEVQSRLAVRADGALTWNGHEIESRSHDWEELWLEVWDNNGRLVLRLWPLEDDRLEHLPSAPQDKTTESITIFDASPELRLRTLTVPFRGPGAGPGWTLRVMRIDEPEDDALGALLAIIVIALPVVIALLVVGGYSLTRHWLKPLDKMVDEANRITAEDLSRRLPVPNPNDELGRLAVVFNVTLDRLESSFQALDRFVADASHELRTPLTTLRSVGEVGLKRGRTLEEYREIIGSMLEEAQRLQLLIERLLELARAEGGAEQVRSVRLRLDEFVAECVGDLGAVAEITGKRITLDASECSVVTDAVIFHQALQNLIDNAIKYSPADSIIAVTVDRVGEVCRVSVRDSGPGIPAEHRPYITDRFFRSGGVRGRSQGGFGLGLAITNAYMRVLGGSLDYAPAQPHGSVFSLTLPAA